MRSHELPPDWNYTTNQRASDYWTHTWGLPDAYSVDGGLNLIKASAPLPAGQPPTLGSSISEPAPQVGSFVPASGSDTSA